MQVAKRQVHSIGPLRKPIAIPFHFERGSPKIDDGPVDRHRSRRSVIDQLLKQRLLDEGIDAGVVCAELFDGLVQDRRVPPGFRAMGGDVPGVIKRQQHLEAVRLAMVERQQVGTEQARS